MASFDIAYHQYIQPNEGGYAYIPGDKGGETYAGIARNFHPGWPGWHFIDLQKRNGPIRHNTKFPDIQYLVDDFYHSWWDERYFGQISSQEVANILFDFNVNSDRAAIKTVQRLVNVTADGVMGQKTINAINSTNPATLYSQLKTERKAFYDRIVQRDPSQGKFYDGWMARLATFQDLPIGGLGVVLGLGLLTWYLLSQSPGSEKKNRAPQREQKI